VAAALASSVHDRPVDAHGVFIGEIGLGGEDPACVAGRAAPRGAEKMGMRTAYVAKRSVPARVPKGLKVVGLATLADLFKAVAP